MFRAKGGIDRDSGHEHVAMAIGASCSIRMRPEIVNVRHDKHLYSVLVGGFIAEKRKQFGLLFCSGRISMSCTINKSYASASLYQFSSPEPDGGGRAEHMAD